LFGRKRLLHAAPKQVFGGGFGKPHLNLERWSLLTDCADIRRATGGDDVVCRGSEKIEPLKYSRMLRFAGEPYKPQLLFDLIAAPQGSPGKGRWDSKLHELWITRPL